MPNNVIPDDPGKVGLEVVDNGHEFLVVKAEKGGAFTPSRRVIARCDNRPDADAIVYWVREGLFAKAGTRRPPLTTTDQE